MVSIIKINNTRNIINQLLKVSTNTTHFLSFLALCFTPHGTPNPVKVLEVCRVAPPPISPDSAVPTSLPLIFFDLFWVKCPPVQRIFFFEASHPTTTFLDSVLPKLKHSLSLTLQHYLVLAGNLTWPPNSYKPIIQYIEGDDAVSLTIAESEADFYHLSSNSFRKVKEIHPFLPLFISSDTQAPLIVADRGHTRELKQAITHKI
ncbi:hypothetical protein HYC85_002695 [Camellia sinensis]|uniref:Uncharacterized protein n=1 Tax=Camellia sinensis TaxID=4442 RepID=A0A7J7IAE6_CAMSI|nr:hypothetical protein HYC85_002695 [Camellia sinensis]